MARIVALSFLLAFITACGQASPFANSDFVTSTYTSDRKVRQDVLANGMKVLTWPKPGSGMAKVQLWVGTGSNHEEEFSGMGLSHFLEHSLFDGTKPLIRDGNEIRKGWGNAEIQRHVTSLGGYSNAWTNSENTVYLYELLADDVAEGIMLLEAEVMRPELSDEILTGPKGEVRAIVNELRRNQENPGRELWYFFSENMFSKRGYGVPTIGYVQPIQQVNAAKLNAYYKRRYVPNNMALVIVGDVDHDAVVAKAREAFIGPDLERPFYPRGPLRKVTQNPWPKFQAEREFLRESPKVNSLSAYIGYRTFGHDHEDAAAGRVLDTILSTATRSGRVQREIGDDKSSGCISIGTSPSFYDEAGCFMVIIETDTVANMRTIRDRAQNIIDDIAAGNVDQTAINRSKTIILNGMLEQWQSLDGVVRILGKGAVSYNNKNWHKDEYEAVSRVSREEVVRFAKKWLRPTNRLTAALVPKGKMETTAESVGNAGLQKPVARQVSDNVELVLRRDDSVPFFGLTVAIRGGVMAESKDNNGVGALAGALMGRATEGRDTKTIQDLLDDKGLTLRAQSGNNSMLVSVSGPRSALGAGVELVSDVLYKTKFDTEEFNNERKKLVKRLLSSHMRADGEVDRRGRQAMFPGHPYELDAAGDPAVIEKLTPAHLKDHVAKLTSGYMSIGLAGDIALNDADLDALLARTIGAGTHKKQVLDGGPAIPKQQAFRSIDVPFESQQTYINWRLAGPPRLQDEGVRQVALRVLRQRLVQSIRNRDGLSYSAGAYVTGGFGPSAIVLYADTDAYKKLDRIRHNFKVEMKTLCDELIDEDRLASTARSMAFGEASSNATAADLAQSLALRRLYGEPLDKSERMIAELKSVTPKQVREFCRAYFRADVALEVVVRDKKHDIAVDSE